MSSVADALCIERIDHNNVPFGRAKTPDSEPFWSAWLKWVENALSETPSRLLLARTYFLIA